MMHGWCQHNLYSVFWGLLSACTFVSKAYVHFHPFPSPSFHLMKSHKTHTEMWVHVCVSVRVCGFIWCPHTLMSIMLHRTITCMYWYITDLTRNDWSLFSFSAIDESADAISFPSEQFIWSSAATSLVSSGFDMPDVGTMGYARLV